MLLRLYQSLVPKPFRPREIARRRLVNLSHGRIIAGPFASMRYFDKGDAWSQRILGTYEIEIRGAIEQLRGVEFDAIIDIGAADGFYAVGFAIMFPRAKSIAYEMLPEKRVLIQELAKLNQVRVDVRGECKPEHLANLATRSLVFIDAEGAEADILDPALSPGLTNAHILAELHEFARPGLANLLQSRFEPTHTIQRFPRRPRNISDLPFQPGWLSPWYRSMMSDGRPFHQEWWLMTPASPHHQ